MSNTILLEYKQTKGQWHFNMVIDGKPHDQSGVYDWDIIAYTTEDKARIFTNMMDCKLHKREHQNLTPYTTEHIRKEWKLFCYVFNEIVQTIEITPELKAMVNVKYNSATALARLGNGHFSDLKEDEELDWAWEYDPLNFLDSNF